MKGTGYLFAINNQIPESEGPLHLVESLDEIITIA